MYYRAKQLEFPFTKNMISEKEFYVNMELFNYFKLGKELQKLTLTERLNDVKIKKIKEESSKIWEIL